MKILITSDLHLTDREEDAYRWDVFPKLCEQARAARADYIAILGDLTDRKDNHSSALLHRIVQAFNTLPAPVLLLKGNHDYIEEGEPFFSFLEHLKNTPPVHYFSNAALIDLNGYAVLMVPHTRSPENLRELRGLPNRVDLVLAHFTVQGAVAESGTPLEGIPRDWFPDSKLVICGDVHVAQQLGPAFYYVGTPYHVKWGRVNYEPSFLLVEFTKQGYTVRRIPTELARRVTYVVKSPQDLPDDMPSRPIDRVRILVEQDAGASPATWDKDRASWSALLPDTAEITPVLSAVTDATPAENSSLTELLHEYAAKKGLSADVAAEGDRLLQAYYSGITSEQLSRVALTVPSVPAEAGAVPDHGSQRSATRTRLQRGGEDNAP